LRGKYSGWKTVPPSGRDTPSWGGSAEERLLGGRGGGRGVDGSDPTTREGHGEGGSSEAIMSPQKQEGRHRQASVFGAFTNS